MKLDLVHDIQNSYRKVLNCMSRPGYIENIAVEGEKVDIDICFYRQTLVLIFMLLDAEVSYKIVSEREHEIATLINQLTYAREECVEEADYIFVLMDANNHLLEETFKAAKIGDLIDPHKSATIIVEVEEISNAKEYVLTGPGIEKKAYVGIKAKGNWFKEREGKIAEYPLGIDVIFIDKASNVMCLPRTTQVQKYEGVR